jgi:hypothetical protein
MPKETRRNYTTPTSMPAGRLRFCASCCPSWRPSTLYLLPFREENCSNKRIYAYIQRGPISRIKNATVYRGPIRIRFGRPIPVAEVGTSDLTVQQIVDILKAYYERLFLEPAIAVPS